MEYVERNPSDDCVQGLGHVGGAGGDHEAETESDAGGIDHADHDADRGAGGADRERVLDSDIKTVKQVFETETLALVQHGSDQQSAQKAAHNGREGAA